MAGLVGDIGGTWARFAVVEPDGTIGRVAVRPCAECPGLAEALADYVAGEGMAAPPRRAAISVACPVAGDRVSLTNHPWSFSIEELRDRFGFESLSVVNDFAAVARAVPRLRAGDFMQIGGGGPVSNAAMAVLGPGTGLGVSGLVPTGDGGWAVIEGEGGHATMAATTPRETRVLAELGRTFGHVSAERVLSGPGLVNLHAALCRLDGEPPDPQMSPRDIVSAGLERHAPRPREALRLAAAMLGTFAADVALTLGARGGVYIGGGLVPRYAHPFGQSGFRHRFEDKGRFSDYLAAIPTYVVLHEYPALLGLASLVGPRQVPR
ncbi:MAG: glucokinase [Immundisolibacterales bacterium]|nr:glucokinase [Immundisolibacterales bacterium]